MGTDELVRFYGTRWQCTLDLMSSALSGDLVARHEPRAERVVREDRREREGKGENHQHIKEVSFPSRTYEKIKGSRTSAHQVVRGSSMNCLTILLSPPPSGKERSASELILFDLVVHGA